ncbi:hypothetical protein TWF569_007163 [Orbilia oligospora]|uniref:Uncharacterized protein n=1 Tax=Orbilia oligospora TaxID=2813651 RepID=A0A7C8JG14_ORBOL|nr:hypothetical protein TWF706_011049 [Orbilia oligospora]KAF3091219.1 hypothetical protein TWF103_011709 [Orbilia oligospora]KAF3106976.1 hypothetical protein TWF102_000821 [Orbilia oligospora]KAF3129246.1 hypothetical protein TWF594_011093 [Orbilia oligospora]KAF3143997.1 hypothetical protein TWF569_007163 [Orbilia oligospora]
MSAGTRVGVIARRRGSLAAFGSRLRQLKEKPCTPQTKGFKLSPHTPRVEKTWGLGLTVVPAPRKSQSGVRFACIGEELVRPWFLGSGHMRAGSVSLPPLRCSAGQEISEDKF